MVIFERLHPAFTPDMAGFLPTFFKADDDRPAKEQADARYISGWNNFTRFHFDAATLSLYYPGDPPMHPLAVATLRDEKIYLYPHAWVLILQPNGNYEVSRMD